jgi:hypothetical protein
MLKIGKIYWLEFPGIAPRVIKAPDGLAPSSHPNLIESLFLRSRWYVNDSGEPVYSDAPSVIMGPNDVRAKVWVDSRKVVKYRGISLMLAETEGFEPSIGLYNPITV